MTLGWSVGVHDVGSDPSTSYSTIWPFVKQYAFRSALMASAVTFPGEDTNPVFQLSPPPGLCHWTATVPFSNGMVTRMLSRLELELDEGYATAST